MKTVRAITYGSLIAAAVAAMPSYADVTKNDRIGSPWHVVVPEGYYLPSQQQPLAAVPGGMVATQEGLVRDQVVVAVAPAESAVAGATVPSVSTGPVIATDRRAMPDRGFIISRTGRPYVNVNWGDIVNFDVRDGNTQRTLRHRFDGMDNVVSYADIDPQATWAHNIKVYVNQTHNPLSGHDSGINPF